MTRAGMITVTISPVLPSQAIAFLYRDPLKPSTLPDFQDIINTLTDASQDSARKDRGVYAGHAFGIKLLTFIYSNFNGPIGPHRILR